MTPIRYTSMALCLVLLLSLSPGHTSGANRGTGYAASQESGSQEQTHPHTAHGKHHDNRSPERRTDHRKEQGTRIGSLYIII